MKPAAAGGALSPAAPDGILVVDKPQGPTSHDLVAGARKRFGTRRVGHAGTLDPMATGVLILLFGQATKVASIVTGHEKTYVADVEFGRATDTNDAWGRATSEQAVPANLGGSMLEEALRAERERTLQTPPAVSAIKVGGRRAYRLARQGQPPDLEPRRVRVRSLEVLGATERRLRVRVRASAGYYVRALARDLGSALGTSAHLAALRRIRSGSFSIDEATSWPATTCGALQPLAQALPGLLPTVRLTEAGVLRARQGKELAPVDFLDDPIEVRSRFLAASQTPDGDSETAGERALWGWTDTSGAPVALGRADGERYRVQRGFHSGAVASPRSDPDPGHPPPSHQPGV